MDLVRRRKRPPPSTSFRLSERTRKQLRDLGPVCGSQAYAVQLAVDRLHRYWIEHPEAFVADDATA